MVKFSPRLKAAPGLRIRRNVSRPPNSMGGSAGSSQRTAMILVSWSSSNPPTATTAKISRIRRR